MCHVFSVSRHLGCFPVVATVNNAALKVGIQCLFELQFSLDICPGVGLLDHMVALSSVQFSCSVYPTLCDPMD